MPNTILIVEDDADTTRLVRLYLGRDGHKVLAAADGMEGLHLAREARPDLVVLDLVVWKFVFVKFDSFMSCLVIYQRSHIFNIVFYFKMFAI